MCSGKPLLCYAVLVAISVFNDEAQTSSFIGLPEMVELAARFKLILNEMWVVPRHDAERVSKELHELRWEGGDAAFTAYLDNHCEYKVHSLLPHSLGQGELLEGLVVQACRTSIATLFTLQDTSESLLSHRNALVSGLREFTANVPENMISFTPPDCSESVPNIVEYLNEVLSLTIGESPLQLLLQHIITEMPMTKLRFFSFKRIYRGNNVSVIVHVHQDQIFFDYQKKKPPLASNLYRGMEIFVQREVPFHDSNAPKYSRDSLSSWRILGISKWKNWNYLRRTFCMRNPLSSLFLGGFDTYMTQVRRQIFNWGLPQVYIPENENLMISWAKWLIQGNVAKEQFLKNKRSFSYLHYLEKFMPLYESGQITFNDDSNVNSVLFIYYFNDKDYSDILVPLRDGYVPSVPEKKAGKHKAKFRAGNVYTFTFGRLPTATECPSPHFCVVIAPSDDCHDKRAVGLYQTFQRAVENEYEYPIVFLSNPKEEISAVVEQLRSFNSNLKSKPKYVVSMLAMQPGSGKSSLAKLMMQGFSERELNAILISSDFFGMKNATSVKRSKDSASKKEFEDAVITALRCPANDVVIYDKNIPNMNGFDFMKGVAARAGISNIVFVPLVPDSCSKEQSDICIDRVLRREQGSHTLTSHSQIEGYESVSDFISEVFAQQCMDFIPIAKMLPGALILEKFYYQKSSTDLNNMAIKVVDEICNWNCTKQGPASLCLAGGSYLGLKFELDDVTRMTFSEIVGTTVRKNVHVTIVYFGDDPVKMMQAAEVLKSIDIENNGMTKDVCITRLGRVVDDKQEPKRTLVWGTCVAQDFEDFPLHITLHTEGFRNVDARTGELAYNDGSVVIDDIKFDIDRIPIEPVTFEAVWAVD